MTYYGEGLRPQMDNRPFSSVHQHPAAADLYLRHGWRLCEIPYGSKAPTRAGWNRENGWIISTQVLPPQCNLGLLHAFSGTCAIDIDDWEQAAVLLRDSNLDLDHLYQAPDAVTIESGKPGHGKLLYEMPFPGFTLPSKKIAQNGKTILELRCGTTAETSVQDVLPPSMHPETGQAYQWGGQGRWDRLPAIPSALLDFWQQQLVVPERPQKPHIPADWEEIAQALDVLPPDCDRETWLQIAMALHHEGMKARNEITAYQLFSTWSAGDPLNPPANYAGHHDIEVVWRSLKIDHQDPVTIGTLFAKAREHGWSKPTPSAEHLFQSPEQPIDIFAGLRPMPPAIDLDLVPPLLARRADEISKIVGCDPLVPFFASLGAVCAAVDSRSRLKLTDGYEVPPILWLCTIGEPSDKKSPGSKPMMAILRDIEREDLPRYKQAELEFKVKSDIYKRRYTEFMEWHADEHNQSENTVAPEPPMAPAEPAKLRLTVQDITSQKLMHHGVQQPRGMLCYLDEMNGWFKALTHKMGHESTSTWIDGYEGGYASMDRVAAGTLECDPFSVSIYGNVQPWVWRDFMPMLTSDGFLARFLTAPLRGQYSKLSEPMPDEITSKTEYESLIRHIFAAPKQTYTLSPEAYEAFRQNQKWVHRMQSEERILQKDKLDQLFAWALGKADGTVGRLIFVFHLVESPLESVVSVETANRAIQFFRQYALPALRYSYGEIAGVVTDSLDVWLASHIIAICGERETVTLRELKRSARRRIDIFAPTQRTQVMLDSVAPLEDCRWLALVDSNPRAREYTWAINPKLKESFADYRKQIITIRQRRLDENVTIANKRKGGTVERRLVPGYDPEWDS